jgi:uncharacterized membrane protein
MIEQGQMAYNSLKFLHIISATLLLLSMAYSCKVWATLDTHKNSRTLLQQIQTQTWLIILPLAVIQLATGFTMISLNHEDLSQIWIVGSVIGFVTALGSWFAFIYFLLLSQQMAAEERIDVIQFKFYRRIQSAMISVCILAFMTMIFFMANKIS